MMRLRVTCGEVFRGGVLTHLFATFFSLVSLAQAHGTDAAAHALTKQGFQWKFDPALLFFVSTALLYSRGLYMLRGKNPIRNWQRILFFAGIGVFTIADLPPVDT